MSHLRELSSGKTSLARDTTGGREGGVNCLEGTPALSKSEMVDAVFWRLSVLRALGAVGRAGGWRWRDGSPTTARRATLRKLEDGMYLEASSSLVGRPRIRFCVSTGKSPNGILGSENINAAIALAIWLVYWSYHCSPKIFSSTLLPYISVFEH